MAKRAERDDICEACGKNIYKGVSMIATNPFDKRMKPPWVHEHCAEMQAERERNGVHLADPEPEHRNTRKTINADQARRRLGGRSRNLIYTMISDGRLEGGKLAGRVFVYEDSLDRYIDHAKYVMPHGVFDEIQEEQVDLEEADTPTAGWTYEMIRDEFIRATAERMGCSTDDVLIDAFIRMSH